MNPTRLRGWIKKYGNTGVIAVAVFLGIHYLWLRREAGILALTIAILLLTGACLCLGPKTRPIDVRRSVPVPRVQSSANAALIAAIKACNITQVQSALSAGASPNAVDKNGVPAVILARELGNEDNDQVILRLLIEEGADPNTKDISGIPLLTLVISDSSGTKSNASWVKMLLERGADPTTTDPEGQTPLMEAAIVGNEETVKMLIARVGRKGVRAVSHEGITALHQAALDGNADNPSIVKLLLDAGADPNAENEYGLTPLWKATFVDCHAGWSSPKVMQYLLTHGAKVRNRQGDSPLSWAALGKKVEAIRVLLNAGADPNERGDDRFTTLMTAVEPPDYDSWGSVEECARLLIRRGADPNIRARDGSSALSIARAAGECRVVRLLRQAGARR